MRGEAKVGDAGAGQGEDQETDDGHDQEGGAKTQSSMFCTPHHFYILAPKTD